MAYPFAWSYSQLKNYETCPKRYYHYNVGKDVTEPESDQLKEGNDLHVAFDKRLKGTPLPMNFAMYEPILARILNAAGETLAEQKLAITNQFQPIPFFGGSRVWFRTVIDAAKIHDGVATIADWKTGRVKEDPTQLKLMAATTFIHRPDVHTVRSGLFFVNEGKTILEEYTRDDQREIWLEMLPRVKAVQQARETQHYPPKPSGLCKKYCAVISCPFYGRGGR